jgi:RIO kinase 1
VPRSAYGRSAPSRGKRRFDDESTYAKRDRHLPRLVAEDAYDAADGVVDGDRWSTWDQSSPAERGPVPHPDWLVTELAATDTELGILKTGKEADVFLLRRGVPGTDRSCLLAAKRYRPAEHRQFHRDAEYLDGRRVRESRVNRAMANRTSVGRELIAQQWASAEFAALCQLHVAGVPVPYPVQILDTEILLEFIGDPDGVAAPRLAETRPSGDDLVALWDQVVSMLRVMAGLGLAHGDLSAYNLLVHDGRIVVIDLPQVIDVVAHPRGAEFLERDAANVSRWFIARGLSDSPAPASLKSEDLLADLRYEARLD